MQAGEDNASSWGGLKQLIVIAWVYFIGWPMLSKFIFGAPKPDVELGTEDEEAAPQAHWALGLLKVIVTCFCLFALLLVMIYFKQESMLYVPSQPI